MDSEKELLEKIGLKIDRPDADRRRMARAFVLSRNIMTARLPAEKRVLLPAVQKLQRMWSSSRMDSVVANEFGRDGRMRYRPPKFCARDGSNPIKASKTNRLVNFYCLQRLQIFNQRGFVRSAEADFQWRFVMIDHLAQRLKPTIVIKAAFLLHK